MPNSFLQYKNSHIRVDDLGLALIFSILVRLGMERGDDREIFGGWQKTFEWAGPGLYDFNLGGYWETEEGRLALLDLLDQVEMILRAEGEMLAADKANALLLTDRFQCDALDTSWLLNINNIIRDLINKY